MGSIWLMEEDKYFTEGNYLLITHPEEGYQHIVDKYAPMCVPSFGLLPVPVASSRVVATYRLREDGFTHPAHTSRSNLAAALALLSRWRLFK